MRRTSFSLAGYLIETLLLGTILLGTATLAAQEPPAEWQTASGMYQGEYAITIGEPINPKVVIDGLRWTQVSIDQKKEKSFEPDEQVDVIVTLGFENPTSEKYKINIILMLENESGHKVGEPLNLREEKIGRGDTEVFEQKHQIGGQALLDTRKIYVLCELS